MTNGENSVLPHGRFGFANWFKNAQTPISASVHVNKWIWAAGRTPGTGGEVRHQNFRGCSATPVLRLQNALKFRKSAATRVARHV